MKDQPDYVNLSGPIEVSLYNRSSLPSPGEYPFWLRDRWAIHLYFTGEGTLTVGRESRRFKPGLFSLTPAGVESVYRLETPLEYVCAHFFPAPGAARHGLARFIDADPLVSTAFTYGADDFIMDPVRSRARLWTVLLDLSRYGREAAVGGEGSLWEKALTTIHGNLFNRLTLAGLSDELGVSPVHLNRLFRSRLDTSVYRYILNERMKRIGYLITETELPLKQIAAESGYDDLQSFNKHCRRYLGESPRGLRDAAES